MIHNRLKDIFHNVNEWLKFAEAKHAGFLVLNSGIIFGVLSVKKDFVFLPSPVVFISLLLLGLSVLFSLISLFPRSGKPELKKDRPKDANLFFSGHLRLFDVEGLKQQITEQSNLPAYIFDGYEEDLIRQIIVNADIASRKYRLFKYALLSTTAAFVVPISYTAGCFFCWW